MKKFTILILLSVLTITKVQAQCITFPSYIINSSSVMTIDPFDRQTMRYDIVFLSSANGTISGNIYWYYDGANPDSEIIECRNNPICTIPQRLIPNNAFDFKIAASSTPPGLLGICDDFNNWKTVNYYEPSSLTTLNPGTIIYSPSPLCYGTSATLSLSGVVGSAPFSYAWFVSTDNGVTWTNTGVTTSTLSTGVIPTRKYICTVTAAGWVKSTPVKTVTVIGTSAFSTGVIGLTQSICYNTATSLLYSTTAPSGGSSSYTYQWESSLDNTNWTTLAGATGGIYQPATLTQNTYYRRKVTDATCGNGYTNTVLITVYSDVTAGSVTANQTICNGATPALLNTSASPTGGNGSYSVLWQNSTDNSIFADISGALGSTYQPPSLTGTYYYRKKVTNTCKVVYTNSIAVTVQNVLVGGTIGNTQTICYNTTPSQIGTTVNSTGGMGSYTYAWESSPDGSSWSTISGATLVSYQPAALTQTTFYRKKTTDSSCGSVYSNTVTVNVRGNFLVGIIGNAQTICFNTAPSILVNATAPSGGEGSYSYQWENSTDNITFYTISGATAATYQPSALTVNTYYKRKVTDASCGNGYTNTVLITVKANFSVGTLVNNQTVCYNAAPTLITNGIAPSGGMGTYSYFWEFSINGTDWSIISSASGATYQAGALTQTTYYRRNVTDASCGNGYNAPVTITVRPIFNAGSISDNQTICFNSAPSLLITSVAPSGGTGSFTNSFESSTDAANWDIIGGATGTTYQPPVLSVKTYYRKGVVDACGSGYTPPVTMTLRNPVNVGTIGSSQTICYNTAPSSLSTDVAPTGGTGVFTWQWESSLNGSTWSTIVGANVETYQPNNLTVSTYFRRNVFNSCGNGTTNTVFITVRPNLVAGSIGNAQTLCFNSTPTLLATNVFPSGGTGTYSFQWQSSPNGSAWSNIVGATNEVYQPSALSSTVHYQRLETSGACGTVTTNPIQIAINGQLVAGSVKSDQTICYGSTPSILLTNTYPSGGTGTYTYQWQKLIGSSWTDITNATSETFTPPALTATSYYRRAETSGTCGTVFTPQVTITVYNQFLAGVIGSAQTVNYNAAPSEFVSIQDASGATGVYTYQWKNSLDNSFWSTITGATEVSYQAPALTVKTYYKRETTSGACGTIQTNTLTVSVNAQLNAGEISSNQTICSGTAPSLFNTSIPSSGGNGSYVSQWQKTEDGVTWANITGANSDTYQSGSLTVTTYFRKRVTSVSTDAFTNIITVTLHSPFAAGSIGADQIICFNSVPSSLNSISLPSGGNGVYTNQWKQSLNGSSWADIIGATESFYEPSALTVKTYYKKAVTNLCGVKETNSVTIMVNPPLTAGSIASSQTILFNTVPQKFDVSTAPTGGTGVFSYQWQSSTDNTIWTNINGAADAFYQSPAIAQTTYFKRLTTSGTCGTIATNTLLVTVTTEVLVGTIGADQVICHSSTPNPLTTITQPSQGVVINSQIWQKSEDGSSWADITAATDNTYQPAALTVKTYYRKKMVTANSGTINTNIATITVNPAFNAGIIGSDQTICKTFASTPLNTTVEPNGQSVQTLWQLSDNNTSWTDIVGAVGSTYDAGILSSSKYYRKRVTNTCASGFTNSVKITVNDELSSGTIGSDQSIAHNTSPALLVGNLPAGGSGAYSYQWYYSTNNIDWNVVISGGNDKDYQAGALTQRSYFKRSVSSGSCGVKFSNTVTVTVLESLISGTISAAQSICFNTAPALLTGTSPSGGTGQYSYQWSQSVNGTSWSDIFGEVGISYQAPKLTVNTYFRRSTISGSSSANSNYIMVQVYDLIATPVTNLKTSYCKGLTVNLDIVNPAYLSYKWYDANKNYLFDGSRYSFANFSESKTVNVRSLSSNGCLSDYLEQTVTLDNVKASFTQDISAVTVGNAVKFTSTSVNALTFAWNFYEGDIINEQNPTHYYNSLSGSTPQTFNVQLSVVSPIGCSDILTSQNAVTVNPLVSGIDETVIGSLSAYPNPVEGMLTIHSTARVKSVRVFSVIGSLISATPYDAETVRLDLSGQRSGVYLLEVTDAQGVKKNLKILKK